MPTDGHASPKGPHLRLDAEEVRRLELTWHADPQHRLWLVAEDDAGRAFHLRINGTFPDEPMYSLLVGPDETVEFDDLPETWQREGSLDWDT